MAAEPTTAQMQDGAFRQRRGPTDNPIGRTSHVERFTFGFLPDGRRVDAVRLSNSAGLAATILAFGATLQGFMLPGANGEPVDVVLGHDSLSPYVEQRHYFGSTVGRVANRIAGGTFALDGELYRVPRNDGDHALHGGDRGFDQLLWEIAAISDTPCPSVELRLLSADGDQGFPGNLGVVARYALDDANMLSIDYWATTDRATIVNITNHAYWNLVGEGAAEGALRHKLTLDADLYLPVDATLIPSGTPAAVRGTPFDFREPEIIGERVRDARHPQIAHGRGYDHCWLVKAARPDECRHVATVEEPHSGRGFALWSNQPGVQFYSGNFLDGRVAGKSGRFYRQGDAIVLEPQRLPDCVNQPALGAARLEPGEVYHNRIEYRFVLGDGR